MEKDRSIVYTRHYLTASSLTGRENTHPDHPSTVPIFAGSCNLADPRVNSWMCLRYVAFCLRLLKWKHGGDLFEDTESREIDLNNIFSLSVSLPKILPFLVLFLSSLYFLHSLFLSLLYFFFFQHFIFLRFPSFYFAIF